MWFVLELGRAGGGGVGLSSPHARIRGHSSKQHAPTRRGLGAQAAGLQSAINIMPDADWAAR